MRDSARILCALAVLLCLPPKLFPQCDTSSLKDTLHLATGDITGDYYAIGQAASRSEHGQRHPLAIITTQGSWENLRKLECGEVDLALAQLNAVIKYTNVDTANNIRVVGQLYTEYLHIVVREPFNLRSCADLAGRRVYLGAPGSGTNMTVSLLLDLMGVSTAQLVQYDDSVIGGFDDVRRLFSGDSLDVAVHVGAAGNKFVDDLLLSTPSRLFSLDPSAVRRLLQMDLQSLGIIGIKSIPARGDAVKHSRVSTLAVPATLVTAVRSKDIGNRAERILAIDSTIREAIDSLVPANSEDDIRTGVSQIALPESLVYPVGNPLPPWYYLASENRDVILALIAMGLIGFLIYRILLRRGILMRGLWTKLALLVLIMGVAGFVVLYIKESSVNRDYDDIWEFTWSVILYLFRRTSIQPVTIFGGYIGTFLLILSVLFIPYAIGYLTSKVIKETLEGLMSGKSLKEGAYVILNWNPRARDIADELFNSGSNGNKKPRVTLIHDDPQKNFGEFYEKKLDKDLNKNFNKINFKYGRVCDAEYLESVEVLTAESIVILSDPKEGDAADEKTLRSLLALGEVYNRATSGKKSGNNRVGKPNVVVELLNHANDYTLRQLRASFPLQLDWVAGNNVRTHLLAHAAVVSGLTDLYRELLTFGKTNNELYSLRIPDSVFNAERGEVTFHDYATRILAYSTERTKDGKSQPLLPVGVRRDDEEETTIAANPELGTDLHTLRAGDEIIVIALDKPKDDALPGN